MNKHEKQVIENVIRRLRTPNAEPKVNEAVEETCKLYLETWVIGPLELLIAENRCLRDLELAVHLSS